jgi:excisionase family DNA binding protein
MEDETITDGAADPERVAAYLAKYLSKAAGRPVLLRPDEAAEALRVGRTKLFELLRTGEVRSVKIGHLRRVAPSALAEYVARLEVRL